jgi:hypothetical protein
MGVTILGANADANADIQLSEDDKGKLLRLALDDAVRKSLPKIDQFLKTAPDRSASEAPRRDEAPPAPTPAPTPQPEVTGVLPAPDATAAKKFCPECGAANTSDAKFCAKCGHKLN